MSIKRETATSKEKKGYKEIELPAFTRDSYTKCAYKTKMNESLAPGMYQLTNQVRNDCFMDFPGGRFTINQPGSLIDIESELKNQTRAASRCPKKKYNPLVNCKDCESCDKGLPCDCEYSKNFKEKTMCNKQLYPTDTRERHSINNISEINHNRFESLCIDVQRSDRIQDNTYQGINTRTLSKDQHRSKKGLDNSSKKAIQNIGKYMV